MICSTRLILTTANDSFLFGWRCMFYVFNGKHLQNDDKAAAVFVLLHP